MELSHESLPPSLPSQFTRIPLCLISPASTEDTRDICKDSIFHLASLDSDPAQTTDNIQGACTSHMPRSRHVVVPLSTLDTMTRLVNCRKCESCNRGLLKTKSSVPPRKCASIRHRPRLLAPLSPSCPLAQLMPGSTRAGLHLLDGTRTQSGSQA